MSLVAFSSLAHTDGHFWHSLYALLQQIDLTFLTPHQDEALSLGLSLGDYESFHEVDLVHVQ